MPDPFPNDICPYHSAHHTTYPLSLDTPIASTSDHHNPAHTAPVTTFPPPTSPPTPVPSVTYSFSSLGLQNIVLDATIQGQNRSNVNFNVPFSRSNGKVAINVQGNNPSHLRLWVNGIEVQKGTLLPIYVEFVIPAGVLFGGSNTLVIGWGMGSSPTPSTITILNTSYITVIKTGICISL